MKNKRKNTTMDNELFNMFKDVYENPADCLKAVRDAKRMYSLVKSDALFNDEFYTNDEI